MQEISPKFSNNDLIIKKIIDEIEKCNESAHIMRTLILQRSILNDNDDQELQKALEHHSLMVLNNVASSLSMLRVYDFEGGITNKRKISSSSHCADEKNYVNDGHEFHKDALIKKYPSKNKRGCYRRRRYVDSRVMEVAHLSDDGFAWRKYGQKKILDAKHPRNYFRCTHKHEQNCQAAKQVQQISENPNKHIIIYHGYHTCNNILKPSPTLLDTQVEDHPSSIVVSFENSNWIEYPSLFPTSATFFSDAKAIEEQYSPCSDLTAITGHSSSTFTCDQSEEIISAVDQNRPSSSNGVGADDMVADYSYVMADYSQEELDWSFILN